MTETQERFLRTVLTRVPLDSVVELHLFPPIRRGTLETGVAVIATALPPAPLTVVEGDIVAEVEFALESELETIEVADASEQDDELMVAEQGDELMVAEQGGEDESAVVVSEAGDADPVSDEDEIEADGDAAADWGDEIGEIDDVTVTPPPPSPRMRILTASYRHTIKGVERGKWTVDVQEEADAPLEAVELVLRGVRHRSTEPADPELVTHDALAALLAPVAVAPAA